MKLIKVWWGNILNKKRNRKLNDYNIFSKVLKIWLTNPELRYKLNFSEIKKKPMSKRSRLRKSFQRAADGGIAVVVVTQNQLNGLVRAG